MPGRGKEILFKIDEFKKINQLDSLLQKLSSFGAEGDRRAQDWRDLMENLEAHQVSSFIKIDLSIVRGLAYYTGFVYEAFEASGEGRLWPEGAGMMTSLKNSRGILTFPRQVLPLGI